MATVLGLAMKITADASSLSRSLTPVDRALQKLGEQASASASLFDKFLGSTTGAAAAQGQFATDVAFLTSELKRGVRSAPEFAAELAKLEAAAKTTAAAFAEAQSITERFSTDQEKQASRLQRLAELYELNGFNLTTYNRAAAEALGIERQAAEAAQQRADAVARRERAVVADFDANAARAAAEATQLAAAAERERAAFLARASQLQEQARTPLQRYDADVQELVTHLNAGNLNQQQFNTLVAQATQTFVRAESAAKGYDVAVEAAGKKGNLAFNELAGTLAILPGPIGNVAGRLSGISSAAEGLNRIFSNGGGIGQFGAAIAGLVNPTTLALGGLAAFSAGAVAAGRSLVQLEAEVERLGQLADRLGVSFGFIQVLEVAAKQTGGTIEDLGAGFTKFLRSLDDARGGGKNAADAFRELGIGAEQVRSADPENLFTQAAAAIAKMEDPAKRAAVAVALFGKSGAELLPVFRQLGTAAADLERIGGAITDRQKADIDAFGDAMDRLGVASGGLSRQITANFAPVGKTIADQTAEGIGALNRFMATLDDTANSKTWLGFQKSAERLKVDQAILDSRKKLASDADELRANKAIAELIVSIGRASDGSLMLGGDLAKAQAEAAQFGESGTQAFLAFAKSLEDIAAAAEGAGLSQDQLGAAVANARRGFEEHIQILGKDADAQKRAAEEADRAAEQRVRAAERIAEADRRRVDAFMQNNGMGDQVGAAEDLLAITRQIEQAEKAIGEARANNDREAETAAIRRLRALDQAKAAAQDNVAFGFNENDIARAVQGARQAVDDVLVQGLDFGAQGAAAALEFEKAFAQAKQNLQLKLIDPKQFEEAIQKQRQVFDERIKQAEEVQNLELQLINERAALEERKLREVARGPLQLADVRTTEGQRQFLAAAGATEDPAVVEFRRGREAIERLERKIAVVKNAEIK